MTETEGKKVRKGNKKEKMVLNNEADEKLSPDITDKTRSRFDQLYQQAISEVDKAPLSKKKKRKTESVLDNLRKGDGLAKTEDFTLKANIFDPDDHPKSAKSNKRRQRLKDVEGQENEAFEDQESQGKPGARKAKSAPPEKTITMEMTVPLTQITGKKKKRKKKKEDQPAASPSQSQEVIDDVTQTADIQQSEGSTQTARETKARKDASTVPASPSDEGVEVDNEAEEERDESPDYSHIPDDGRILTITLHKTDKLKTNHHMSHPMVRLHIVDQDTGHYLKKQTRQRQVTFYYENQNDTVDFIMPVISQPFDFKKNRSIVPCWEEQIILNENFNYFTQEKPRVIIFFEVLDFVSMSQASSQFRLKKEDSGWHKVAWGFLKVRGANEVFNVGKKVRLQLFYPFYSYKPTGSQVEVYQWWSRFERTKYPSTLYVTLKGILPPNDLEAAERSMFPLQPEKGTVSVLDFKTFSAGAERIKKTKKEPAQWSRLAGQGCKVPNQLMHSLSAGRMGCFVIRFSPDGKRLACAGHDKTGYPIYVYEIPSGNLLGHLLGHYSIVYDLCWSRDNTRLLSASSDGTARVWNMEKLAPIAEQTLVHPSFVYCAQFHPRVQLVIATGGYDQSVRVWNCSKDTAQAKLAQELSGHSGYVNSICFNEDGDKLFSGDSLGVIRVWNVFVTDQPTRRGIVKSWSSYKVIEDSEIMGSPINFLCMHPTGRRLLVHSRDNTVRMMDLRLFAVMQRYHGGLNFREQLRSCITPCGTFIMAGSEDCTAYVWNAETGDQVAMYAELNFKHPVSDLHFHPYDHIVAFCSFGENHPVMIYKYDPQAAQKELGIKSVVKKLFKPSGVSRRPDGTLIQDELTGMDISTPHTMTTADFSLAETARKDQVIKKLNAVNSFISSARQTPSSKTGMTNGADQTGTFDSTWGSTFDQSSDFLTTLQSRPLGSNVTAVSPHAPTSLLSTMHKQQFTAQIEYNRQSSMGWRPGFKPVGKQSTAHYGRPPQLSLDASHGKPHFSFIGTPSKVTAAKQVQVMVLYDYQAQRSDELNIVRGDVINVLHKDNENWWMGELTNGQQGFFPANYVTEKGTIVESEDEASEKSGELLDDSATSTPRKVMAMVSKEGDLKFMSEAEDSDIPKPTRRKKKAKKTTKTGSTENLVDSEKKPPARRRNRAKKSEQSVS